MTHIRTLAAAAAVAVAVVAQAQNVQLHYDLGRNIYPDEEAGRPKVTVTLEQFHPDRWGSWFYFVDVDMSRRFVEGAYTEVSREVTLWHDAPLAAHVEYNGGLNRFGGFQQAALVGPAYNGHSADFTRTWSIQAMYKQYFKSYSDTRAYASFQLTGVWSITFARGACTWSGYVDAWRGEQPNGHGTLIVASEPQLWYNLRSAWGADGLDMSIGTEWEISNNFVFNTHSDRTFFFNPTIALKWTL